MKPNNLNRLIANCSEPNTTTRHSSVRKRLVLFAFVFACCVVSVLGVRAYNSRVPALIATLDYSSRELAADGALDYNSRKLAPDAPLKPTARAAQNAAVPPNLPGVVITLDPNGFEPETITRPVGPFALIFPDRTRLDGISLSFEGDSRTPPRRMTVEKRKPERIDTYDLSPGRYVLREENHPGWLCEITITPG